MEIQRVEGGDGGAFEIKHDGKICGKMRYKMLGKELVIENTHIDVSIQGTGAGEKLVKTGIEYARANGYKVFPFCPFAKAVIEKHPAFQDVLAK